MKGNQYLSKHSFEYAKPSQAEFLSHFAMKSNDFYRYRTVSEEEALKIFNISSKHFQDGVVKLMKIEDKIIGFFSLLTKELDGEYINELSDLFLHPECIGRGFGRILFQEAINEARKRGWKKFEWESDPFSAGFYLKMGAIELPSKIRTCPLNPGYKSPRFEFILGEPLTMSN